MHGVFLNLIKIRSCYYQYVYVIKKPFHVKVAALSDELSPYSALPLSSIECFDVFYLISLVLHPTTLLFLFSLTAQVSTCSGQIFSESSDKPTVHYLPTTKLQADRVSN